MTEQKTKPTYADVGQFLEAIAEDRRDDAVALIALMSQATGRPAVLWGTMVGFGKYHYRFASGTEGDMFLVGFAPRTARFTLYLTLYLPGIEEQAEALLARLGRHSRSKGCIHIKRLADIDTDVLTELVDLAVTRLKQEYGEVR